MAHKGTPKHKARYSVTLTVKRVERFRSLCKHLGIPASALSYLCDDAINGMSDVLQSAKDKGSLGVSDIFLLMGKQFELLMEEERRENALYKERRPASLRS